MLAVVTNSLTKNLLKKKQKILVRHMGYETVLWTAWIFLLKILSGFTCYGRDTRSSTFSGISVIVSWERERYLAGRQEAVSVSL